LNTKEKKFSDQLFETRTLLGLSQVAMAKEMGMRPRMYSDYETGKYDHKPGDARRKKHLQKLADLRKGRESLKQEHSSDYFHTSEKPIPYYDVDVSAGKIALFDDNKEVPKSYVSFPAFDDCDFAINIWGDSMYPKYRNGDVIICKEIHDWKSFVQYGEVYLVVTLGKQGDSQRFVKFVRKSDKRDHFKMVSENQKHDDFDVSIGDIRKMYIVKGKLERNQI
jgi:phage repressor protein C with HTH and peptisase S24 domain